MSHLTSTRVANMDLYQRVVATAYRLGWVTPPGTMTWDYDLTSIWGEVIRFIFWPILDPKIHTGPYTVICSSGPYAGGPATQAQVADNGAALCGLSRNTAELDIDLLGRALQAEPAN